jgi:dTDP-4-dehydrorhamnose reductase
MKIAVIGSNGQLGSDVVCAFADRGDVVLSLTHADIELSSLESVKACLGTRTLDVVVNTAAMHHVENCEQEPAKAYAVNAMGARNLAIVTRDLGAVLVHVSTDYVFDGKKSEPYIEDDTPLPLNVYGNTKLAGEHFVRSVNPKHLVLRTSALYGKHPCRGKGGLNFVDLMLKLARERGKVRVVDNEVVTPTSTSQLAKQIVVLSRCDAYGLYHATAEGRCSWYQFAKEIFQIANTDVRLDVATAAEFPAKVPRPSYSILENHALKIRRLNLFTTWQEGLCDYLGVQRAETLTAVV